MNSQEIKVFAEERRRRRIFFFFFFFFLRRGGCPQIPPYAQSLPHSQISSVCSRSWIGSPAKLSACRFQWLPQRIRCLSWLSLSLWRVSVFPAFGSCSLSEVTTLAGGHLSGRLMVCNMTLLADWPTPPPLTLTLSLSTHPYKVVNTCNFLHWFEWTLDQGSPSCNLRALVILVREAVALNRSACLCFAFKQWCWCNKKGIISRQSTCLPLYSSSIKLVQSITWAYWSESSAVERAVCKINALFSPRLAMFMLVFLSMKMRGKQGRSHLLPLYFILSNDSSDSFWRTQPGSSSCLFVAHKFFFTPYLCLIYENEFTSL